MTRLPPSRRRSLRESKRERERGMALLTALMILVIVASLAMSAIQTSEQEMRASGRSRSTSSSLYAAEAGVDFAINRLLPPRDLSAFSFTLPNGTPVQSRTRSDSTPQPISQGGLGKPPSGYSMNIGSGFVSETFQVNVTAGGANMPTTEVEAKLGLIAPNSGVE